MTTATARTEWTQMVNTFAACRSGVVQEYVERVLSALESQEVELRALRPYLTHKITCALGKVVSVPPKEWPDSSTWESANLPCDCGLTELLAALEAPPNGHASEPSD